MSTVIENTSNVEMPHRKFVSAKEVKGGSTFLRKLLILTVIIVLAISGYFLYSQLNRQNANNKSQDNKEYTRNHINEYVTVATNEYLYRKIGGIFNLEVNITNSTDYLLENVTIEITYIKTNGE